MGKPSNTVVNDSDSENSSIGGTKDNIPVSETIQMKKNIDSAVKRKRKEYNFVSILKELVRTCKHICRQIETSVYGVLSTEEFEYVHPYMTPTEVQFYRDRCTPQRILELTNREFQTEAAREYSIMPLYQLTEKQKTGIISSYIIYYFTI